MTCPPDSFSSNIISGKARFLKFQKAGGSPQEQPSSHRHDIVQICVLIAPGMASLPKLNMSAKLTLTFIAARQKISAAMRSLSPKSRSSIPKSGGEALPAVCPQRKGTLETRGIGIRFNQRLFEVVNFVAATHLISGQKRCRGTPRLPKSLIMRIKKAS